MITFTIRQGAISRAGAASGAALPDVAETSWNGVLSTTATASGAVCALARQLVSAGCPDQPWQAVGDDGGRRLFGASLHRVAKLTVNSSDRFMPFTEYPTGLRRAA